MGLGKGDKANFKTLQRAAGNGDLALMQVRRRSDGKEVAAVCAVGRDGEEYVFTPLAIMVEGNPFEMYDPPVSEGGYEIPKKA